MLEGVIRKTMHTKNPVYVTTKVNPDKPKGRRRKAGEPRNVRIAVLTTASHKAAMDAAAEAAGQSLTAYVMRAALAGGMVQP